jgi:molecular chaperone IbpA
MTSNIYFHPHPSFIGFDSLFKQLERAMENGTPQYPPHNIVKHAENKYAIELAVAGFNMQDLDIEYDKNVLVIKGEKQKDETTNHQYVHRGISQKKFVRKFTLAEHIEVTGASLVDGILSIQLEHLVPDELKPRKIEINGPELLIEKAS